MDCPLLLPYNTYLVDKKVLSVANLCRIIKCITSYNTYGFLNIVVVNHFTCSIHMCVFNAGVENKLLYSIIF